MNYKYNLLLLMNKYFENYIKMYYYMNLEDIYTFPLYLKLKNEHNQNLLFLKYIF